MHNHNRVWNYKEMYGGISNVEYDGDQCHDLQYPSLLLLFEMVVMELKWWRLRQH
jgi:hypothetical protein